MYPATTDLQRPTVVHREKEARAQQEDLPTWKAAAASLSERSCMYSATTDLQRPSASFCASGEAPPAAGGVAPPLGAAAGGVGGRPA